VTRALTSTARRHDIGALPNGLWVADSSASGGTVGPVRFEPLPAPATAEVEELAATLARRLMSRVVAAWEARGSDYLDPEPAALCEALFFSRDPPVGRREDPELPGLEGEGFSLRAAQAVPSWERRCDASELRAFPALPVTSQPCRSPLRGGNHLSIRGSCAHCFLRLSGGAWLNGRAIRRQAYAHGLRTA